MYSQGPEIPYFPLLGATLPTSCPLAQSCVLLSPGPAWLWSDGPELCVLGSRALEFSLQRPPLLPVWNSALFLSPVLVPGFSDPCPWVLPYDLQDPCSSGAILSLWVSPDVDPAPPAVVADILLYRQTLCRSPFLGSITHGDVTSLPTHHIPGISAVCTRPGCLSGPAGALDPSLLCRAMWWVSFLLRPGPFCLVTMSILREKLGEIPPCEAPWP